MELDMSKLAIVSPYFKALQKYRSNKHDITIAFPSLLPHSVVNSNFEKHNYSTHFLNRTSKFKRN